MHDVARRVSALAALMLMAAPCMAADRLAASDRGEHRAAAFAGGTVRLAFGGNSAARPSARLQLTTIHSFQDRMSAAPARTYRPAGIELGFSGAKKPALFLMGQEASAVKKKLGFDGGSTGLWILGGLVAAGAALFIVSEVLDNGSSARPAGTR